MVISSEQDMQTRIEKKLGFTIKEYNKMKAEMNKPSHECDNIKNPFEVLTLEELTYMREYNYFLK